MGKSLKQRVKGMSQFNDLTRIADRLRAMGKAQCIDDQIEQLQEQTKFVDVLGDMTTELLTILEQAYFLESELGHTRAAVREINRSNLELILQNKDLQTKCSDQAKVIRTLKASIQEIMTR